MRFVVTIPDSVSGEIVAVLVRGDKLRRVQGQALTVEPYVPSFADVLRDIDPDWEVVRCIAGPEEAERQRAAWEQTHPPQGARR